MFKAAPLTASARSFSTRRTPTRIARFTQNAAVHLSQTRKIPTRKTTVNRVRTTLQFGLAGIFAVGLAAAAYYEGAHLYIEHVGMILENDPEAKKWEWDVVNNNWTGDPRKGGTDPSLGYRARHILHAAWAAYTEETPDTALIVEESSSGDDQTEVIHVVDARLQQTEHHLRNAILLAEEKLAQNKLNSSSFAILLIRHAAVSEQIGVGRFLLLAKEDYERAWQYSLTPSYQQFIAWKLGDLNHRLGHNNDALLWWDRSLQLAQQSGQYSEDAPTSVFKLPRSPMAQRILSSILVSKSAHLAASGKLIEAQALEESALEFIRSIPAPDTIASASAPQALHALYLLQRSSLLSIHLAEVLRAQCRPVLSSIQWLALAAESSGRVACVLTGSQINPSSNSDTKNSFSHSQNNQLLPIYTTSHSMKAPASALLRDARRTAAEAWNMMGILHEDNEGSRSRLALDCYDRAINWAGTVKPDGNGIQAADDILDSDWKIYWANYQRVTEARAKSGQKNGKQTRQAV